MSALRSIVGLIALTLAAVLFLSELDARAAAQRRAVAEREELEALYSTLPPQLRTREFRLERRLTESPGHGLVPWVLVRGAGGEVVAAVVTASARGYNGEIVVQAASDEAGRLLGSRIRSHAETPAYAGDLRARWRRLAADAASRAPGADQLSGATVSARAIAAAVETARAQAQVLMRTAAP